MNSSPNKDETRAIRSETRRLINEVSAQGERVEVSFGAGSTVWRTFGSGPALALIHGGGGAWLHWLRNIPELSKRYTLYVCDLPGHGESSVPAGPAAELLPGEEDDRLPKEWTGTPPMPVAIAARIVGDALAELVPEGPISIAGFSFGGVTSAHIAARMADRIAALVLIGTVGLTTRVFGSPRDIRSWHDAATREEFRTIHRQNLKAMLFGDPSRVDDLAIDVQIECTLHNRVRRTRRNPTTLSAIARAGVPVAGLWGGRDATARDGIDAVRDGLHSVAPGAPFEVIDGAGHWVSWEAADEFNALLPQLLDKLTSDK